MESKRKGTEMRLEKWLLGTGRVGENQERFVKGQEISATRST